MFVRIVKMSFKENSIEEFLENFSSKQREYPKFWWMPTFRIVSG